MLFSIFDVLRIYEALSIFFYKFLLKWEKKWRFWVHHILWSSKILLNQVFLNQGLIFFPNGHICNVVSTSPNVVKIDVENDNIVSTLSNVVQFNVEIYNVVWTLLNVVNFNVDIHNVVSTLIWRCVTSLHHINLKTTLNRRWNVCWVGTNYWCIIKKIFGKDDLFSFPEHITSWACFESGLQDIFHLWAYSDIFCRSLFSSLTTIYNRTWWCVICKEFYCSQKIVW